MDNKIWNGAGNLGGSTGSGRNQGLQPQQQLPLGAANVYAATHWQRIACITAAATANGVAASPGQPQQPPQLRYFQALPQVPKPTPSQYAAHQHQQHYINNYIIAASASSSSPLPERLTQQKRETVQYSYFTTPFAHRSTTLTQTLTLRTLDEGQLHQQHLNSLASHHPVQQRYQILTNGCGHPANPGEVSLTTCFALTTSIEGLYTTTASTSIDPPLASNVQHFPENTWPFVNAFEAVPDMLRDVRPGATTSKLAGSPFFVAQEEFSYHTNKIDLPARLGDESFNARHWPELAVRQGRLVMPVGLRQPITIEDGTVVNDVAEYNNRGMTNIINVSIPSRSSPSERQTSSPGQKTYADVVQEASRHDGSPKPTSHSDEGKSKPVTRMKVQDNRRGGRRYPGTVDEASSSHLRDEMNEDRDEDSNEDREDSTMMESCPNQDCSREGSMTSTHVTSYEREEVESSIITIDEAARKTFLRMAEMFCFGQLEDNACFRAYDVQSRYRKRMPYTEKFSQTSQASFQTAHSEPRLVAAVSLDHQQVRVTPLEERGAVKVLQKLRECPDGTGAIYTNSWRPEELHRTSKRRTPRMACNYHHFD